MGRQAAALLQDPERMRPGVDPAGSAVITKIARRLPAFPIGANIRNPMKNGVAKLPQLLLHAIEQFLEFHSRQRFYRIRV